MRSARALAAASALASGDVRRSCANPEMEQSDGVCGPSLLGPGIGSPSALGFPGNRSGTGHHCGSGRHDRTRQRSHGWVTGAPRGR